MTWQMWLLVGLLASILVGLAGLAWLAWFQSRAMAILRAEVRAGRDQVARSEKTVLEALQRAQGAAEFWRQREHTALQGLAAQEADAATSRQELDRARREARKLAAILARKERRAQSW